MESVVNIMGKHCARCGGGIYTAWRTLDNQKHFHPHCFTCAVCGILMDELDNDNGMQNLEEIYCRRCYKQCFLISRKIGTGSNCQSQEPTVIQQESHTTDADEERPKLLKKFNVCDEINQENNDNDEQHRSRSLLRNLLGPETFKSQGAPNVIKTTNTEFFPVKNFNILYNSPEKFLHHQYQHPTHQIFSNREEIRHNSVKLLQQHHFPQLPNNQSLFNVEAASAPLHQHYSKDYDKKHVPRAFLDMKNNRNSQVRKLERSKSRIPRPTTSFSRKSITANFPSPNNANRSKSKVSLNPSSAALKFENLNRSTTNDRLSCSCNGKIQRSSSLLLQPKSNKSRDGKVLKKDQTRKKACSRLHSISHESITKSLAGGQQHGPFFPKNQQQVGYPEGDFPHQQDLPDTRETLQTFENNAKHSNSQTRQSVGMGLPSPQAILSAIIGKKSSNLKHTTASPPLRKKESRLKNLLPDKKIVLSSSSCCADRTSEEHLDSLSPNKWNFHVTFECPICISSLVPRTSESFLMQSQRPFGNGNVVTSCGHLFHRDCLDNWLKIKGNKRCPICSSLCLPETLQPVYLECNVTADFDSQSVNTKAIVNHKSGKVGKSKKYDAAFKALRSEYDILKAKYNEILAEKNNYSLKVTIANSLQSAYDMECRNRLKLQWENKKLIRQIEQLQNFACDTEMTCEENEK